MTNTPFTRQPMLLLVSSLLTLVGFCAAADTAIDQFEAGPERWGAEVTLTTERCKQGRSALRWPAAEIACIALKDLPGDWSGLSALSFWCFSENATGGRIILTIDADDPASTGGDYFMHSFLVDWTGWKLFEIPLASMGKARRPLGWNHVAGIAFHSKGWGQEKAVPGTVLLLDDLKVVEHTVADLARIEDEKNALQDGCLISLSDNEDMLEYFLPERAVALDFWLPVAGAGKTMAMRRDWHGLTLSATEGTCGVRRSYNLDLAPFSEMLVQAQVARGTYCKVTLEAENGPIGCVEMAGTGLPVASALVLNGGTLKAITVELLSAEGVPAEDAKREATLEWIKLRRPEQPTLDVFSNFTRGVVLRPARPKWGASAYRLLRSRTPIAASMDGAEVLVDSVPAETATLYNFPPESGEWHYALAPLKAGLPRKPGPSTAVTVADLLPPVIGPLAASVVVDGTLTDWEGAAVGSKVRVSGPECHVSGVAPDSTTDLSAAAVFAHSDDHLYIGVTVIDEVVRHDNPRPWEGDGVVVLLRFTPPDAEEVRGRYDLVLNCSALGDARLLEDRDQAYPPDAKPKAPGTWAAQRTPNGYTVEGAVPLKTLRDYGFRPDAGGLGLGVVLFDADQPDGPTKRQTVVSWNQRRQTYSPKEAALVRWQ